MVFDQVIFINSRFCIIIKTIKINFCLILSFFCLESSAAFLWPDVSSCKIFGFMTVKNYAKNWPLISAVDFSNDELNVLSLRYNGKVLNSKWQKSEKLKQWKHSAVMIVKWKYRLLTSFLTFCFYKLLKLYLKKKCLLVFSLFIWRTSIAQVRQYMKVAFYLQ